MPVKPSPHQPSSSLAASSRLVHRHQYLRCSAAYTLLTWLLLLPCVLPELYTMMLMSPMRCEHVTCQLQANLSTSAQARQDADDAMPLPPPAPPASRPPLPPSLPSQARAKPGAADDDDLPTFQAPDEDTIRYACPGCV